MEEKCRKNLQEKNKYLANTYNFDVLLIRYIHKLYKIIFSHTGKDEIDIYITGCISDKGLNFGKVM